MERRILLDIDFDFFIRESMVLDWGHAETPLFQTIAWHMRAIGAASRGLDLDAILTSPNDPSPEDFWDELAKRGWRVDEENGCDLLVGDSHAEIGGGICGHLDRNTEWEVWHFDAHHDLGYENDPVDEREEQGIMTCADWLYLQGRWQLRPIKKIVLVYPEWRREPDPLAEKISLREMDEQSELLQRRIAKLAERGVEVEIRYWNDLPTPEHEVGMVSTCLSSAWVPPWWDQRFEQFCYNGIFDGELWYTEQLGERGLEPREGYGSSWEEVLAQFGPQIQQMQAFGQHP